MTNSTPLSPAAQVVVTAIEKFDWESGHFTREEIWFCSREVVAAALRAAADQVVPEEQRPPRRGMRPGGTGVLSPNEGAEDQRAATRRKLLAIADELEAQ